MKRIDTERYSRGFKKSGCIAVHKLVSALILLFLTVSMFGCGIPQEEYDAVVAERDALIEQVNALQTQLSAVPGNRDIPPPNQYLDLFDEEEVMSQLQITEYSYWDSYEINFIIVIKNNSTFNLEIQFELLAYDENGRLSGVQTEYANAVGSGTETVMDFFFEDEPFTTSYNVFVSPDMRYECAVSDISYEATSANRKEILAVTNNGTTAVEDVICYALFFRGDTLVYYDYAYLGDNAGEIKPGRVIHTEIMGYTAYDSVKIILTGSRFSF